MRTKFFFIRVLLCNVYNDIYIVYEISLEVKHDFVDFVTKKWYDFSQKGGGK